MFKSAVLEGCTQAVFFLRLWSFLPGEPSFPKSICIRPIPTDQNHGPIGRNSRLGLADAGWRVLKDWLCLLETVLIRGVKWQKLVVGKDASWGQALFYYHCLPSSPVTMTLHLSLVPTCQPSSPKVSGKWQHRASSAGRRHQSNNWSWFGFALFKKRA